MKRDMKLVDVILTILDDHPKEYMQWGDFEKELPTHYLDDLLSVIGHLRIMQEAGLIMTDLPDQEQFDVSIAVRLLRLTWKGDDQVVKIRLANSKHQVMY